MARAIISYTNKDYESLREELLSRIPQLTDRWTDYNESDLGVVLLDLFCGIGDMLAYYLDRQANEAYLPTARQRSNVINLCKLINYHLRGPVVATTTLRFTLSEALTSDVIIPAGTICTAVLDDEDEELDFVTMADAIILAGTISIDVAASQGSPKSEAFTSTGEANHVLDLSGKSIAHGSVVVTVGGDIWMQVDTFADSGNASLHYRVEADGLDVTHIYFGSGYRGAVPMAGDVITVSYLETAGADGNIGRDLVTEMSSTIYCGGKPVDLSVTNPIPATGGRGREEIDEARIAAPAQLKTLWKAVTREDFQTLCLGYPGVAKARVIDANDDSEMRYYRVIIAIAPNGGGAPSPILMDGLADYIDSRKVLTVEIEFVDAQYVPVDIDATVFIYSINDEVAIRRRIEDALSSYFAFDNMNFGRSIYVSDVVSLIDGISGVSHVSVASPASDIVVNSRQIPILGTMQLTIAGGA